MRSWRKQAGLGGLAHSEILCQSLWRCRATNTGPQSIAQGMELGIQSVFVELRMMRNMILLFISLLGATPRVLGRENKNPGVRGWEWWAMGK